MIVCALWFSAGVGDDDRKSATRRTMKVRAHPRSVAVRKRPVRRGRGTTAGPSRCAVAAGERID